LMGAALEILERLLEDTLVVREFNGTKQYAIVCGDEDDVWDACENALNNMRRALAELEAAKMRGEKL